MDPLCHCSAYHNGKRGNHPNPVDTMFAYRKNLGQFSCRKLRWPHDQ